MRAKQVKIGGIYFVDGRRAVRVISRRQTHKGLKFCCADCQTLKKVFVPASQLSKAASKPKAVAAFLRTVNFSPEHPVNVEDIYEGLIAVNKSHQ